MICEDSSKILISDAYVGMMSSPSVTTGANTRCNEDSFSECRRTPDGRIKFIDGIAKFNGCSKKIASNTYKKFANADLNIAVGLWKFVGRGERGTPVGTVADLEKFCLRLRGEKKTESPTNELPPYEESDPLFYGHGEKLQPETSSTSSSSSSAMRDDADCSHVDMPPPNSSPQAGDPICAPVPAAMPLPASIPAPDSAIDAEDSDSDVDTSDAKDVDADMKPTVTAGKRPETDETQEPTVTAGKRPETEEPRLSSSSSSSSKRERSSSFCFDSTTHGKPKKVRDLESDAKTIREMLLCIYKAEWVPAVHIILAVLTENEETFNECFETMKDNIEHGFARQDYLYQQQKQMKEAEIKVKQHEEKTKLHELCIVKETTKLALAQIEFEKLKLSSELNEREDKKKSYENGHKADAGSKQDAGTEQRAAPEEAEQVARKKEAERVEEEKEVKRVEEAKEVKRVEKEKEAKRVVEAEAASGAAGAVAAGLLAAAAAAVETQQNERAAEKKEAERVAKENETKRAEEKKKTELAEAAQAEKKKKTEQAVALAASTANACAAASAAAQEAQPAAAAAPEPRSSADAVSVVSQDTENNEENKHADDQKLDRDPDEDTDTDDERGERIFPVVARVSEGEESEYVPSQPSSENSADAAAGHVLTTWNAERERALHEAVAHQRARDIGELTMRILKFRSTNENLRAPRLVINTKTNILMTDTVLSFADICNCGAINGVSHTFELADRHQFPYASFGLPRPSTGLDRGVPMFYYIAAHRFRNSNGGRFRVNIFARNVRASVNPVSHE